MGDGTLGDWRSDEIDQEISSRFEYLNPRLQAFALDALGLDQDINDGKMQTKLYKNSSFS